MYFRPRFEGYVQGRCGREEAAWSWVMASEEGDGEVYLYAKPNEELKRVPKHEPLSQHEICLTKRPVGQISHYRQIE